MLMIGRIDNQRSIPASPCRPGLARGGFTLIEIMVVIAIIIVLVGISVAVGVQVKANAARNSTNATLSSLQGIMSDFLKDHPDVAFGETAWVQAISAINSKSIERMPSTGSGLTKRILDGWGNPIRYVPANYDPVKKGVGSLINKPGFFQSYGPDGMADTNDDMFSPPIAPQ
jgi:prepilin-type N-terminal cleavage/methylation domain-containing protein